MYLNYLNDRKALGYEALKDSKCGMKLVLITDLTLLLIRNLSLNGKGRSKRIIVVVWLGVLLNVKPAKSSNSSFVPGAEGDDIEARSE
jgi:hypothetical protein